MTRKNFEIIADAIAANVSNAAEREKLARALAVKFTEVNPRFRAELFVSRACKEGT